MKNTPHLSAKERLRRLTLSAMFAALVCAATMIIQIPAPLNGYVHLGDTAVLLAAFILGPIYGSCAAGIGSCLADVFTGYLHYAPGTLVIKAVMAFAASLIFASLRKRHFRRVSASVIAGIAAEAIMIVGYFAYGCLLFGSIAASVTGIPGNVMQGIFAFAAASLLSAVLSKVKPGGAPILP